MNIFYKICLLLLINSFACHSQIFVRAYHYRPTGDFGSVFKPGFSAEIGYMPKFEERLRVCVSATYMVMKPRRDAFPIVGIQQGTKTVILPGEDRFDKYNLLHLFAGIDVAIIKRKKFFAYLGTDLTVGVGSVDSRTEVKTLISEGYSGGGGIAGFRGRIGLQYNLTDHIGLIAHVNRTGYILTEPRTVNWFNDYGMGVRYHFGYR
ncbi:MAG: hypothetical protein V4580_14265 [Bacteroidota bacterium]